MVDEYAKAEAMAMADELAAKLLEFYGHLPPWPVAVRYVLLTADSLPESVCSDL